MCPSWAGGVTGTLSQSRWSRLVSRVDGAAAGAAASAVVAGAPSASPVTSVVARTVRAAVARRRGAVVDDMSALLWVVVTP